MSYYVFPVNKENKKEQEEKELELLKKNNIDTIVLARYMQIHILAKWKDLGVELKQAE